MNKAAAYAYPVIETLCCHNASPFYCIVVPEHPPPGNTIQRREIDPACCQRGWSPLWDSLFKSVASLELSPTPNYYLYLPEA
jgi:hypothetical protein